MVPGLNTSRRIWSLLLVQALALTGAARAGDAPLDPPPVGRLPVPPGASSLVPPPPPGPGGDLGVLPPPPPLPDDGKDGARTGVKPVVPNQTLDNGNGGPDVLRRPLETPPERPEVAGPDYYGPSAPFQAHDFVPPGYTGPSGVEPSVYQVDGHFVPVEDRWRIGLPEWDRYGKGHPSQDDYPFDVGRIWDPYRQNLFKGDYPIFGQHTFFEFLATSFTLYEPRQLPTPSHLFEASSRPLQAEFFGRPNQQFFVQQLSLLLALNHGDAAFKPIDWQVVIAPTFNLNMLGLEEVGVTNPNVLKGDHRLRTFSSLQVYFVEKKIADLSPNYDFVSVRIGSQPFVSDFRGFVHNDQNLAVRLFGTYEANRYQYNLIYFDNREKDTNSGLNGSFYDRQQRILIGNLFRQDTIWPGYTALLNFHYNHDSPTFKFNRNSQLVRPDAAGIFQQHGIDVLYLGWGGDGHINRYNITHQFYWALGRDGNNPIGNRGQDIMGLMAAVELSYDRDYARFRSSYFYSSGDGNPNNKQATGFDTIIDNPNFAGTQFSYWQRQEIGLFNVNLKQRLSLVPNLRSSKIQGQSNFVNPGLHLFNLGFDVDITPKLKVINNYNLLWFDKTAVLDQFLFQGGIDRFIGADLSMGVEYRPLLSENAVFMFGLATLIPGEGFKDLYDRFRHDVPAMVAGFTQLTLRY